jgi:putative protease
VLARNKFLLSLKDLNLLAAIPDLAAAGVTSFKIEGRYKGMGYVKNITAAFRRAIDRFIEGRPEYRRASAGKSEVSFSPAPEKTFNRGYTSYFLFGGGGKIASIHTRKSIGEYVGRVTRIGKNFFSLDGQSLHNGDGLCFFTEKEELAGFRVDRVEKERIYPNSLKGLAVGSGLYRNYNIAFDRILKKSSAVRTVGVAMDLCQDADGVRVTAVDEDDNRVETYVDIPFEPARDPAGARKQMEKHLTRTGSTPYRVARLTVSSPRPGFVPPSALNGLRREILDMLTRVRAENYPRGEAPFTPNDIPYPENRLDHRANVLNSHARRFYQRHGVETVEPAFETLTDTSGRQVMNTRYCVRHELNLCPKDRRGELLPGPPLRISDGRHSYRLEFDCRDCRMMVFLEGEG